MFSLTNKTPHASEPDTEQTAKLFYALSDPTRLKILHLLLDREKLCVSDVMREVGISMSGTSQQLKSLEIYGLAVRTRKGQQTCYQPNYDNPHARLLFDCINTLRRKP